MDLNLLRDSKLLKEEKCGEIIYVLFNSIIDKDHIYN